MLINLNDLKPAEKQYYLQHVIAPRPICFASTIDKAGHVNLSPFSFFNLFSSNPPIVVFSPARRVRDNTTKHTLQNVLEVPEVVINIVTYDMVQQMSLASCEFPKDVNEFIKAGFTEIPATVIKPPMVKESKVQLECKVIEVKPDRNEAYFWRGKTKYNGGDFKAADKDLSRFLEYEADNIDALIIRGATRININDNSGAVRDYDEVIKQDPKNFIALTNRGTAKGAMKNFAGALEDLDLAIKIKFDYSPAYINRASIKFASGDKKGACKDLEKADGLNNEKAFNLIEKYCKEFNK